MNELAIERTEVKLNSTELEKAIENAIDELPNFPKKIDFLTTLLKKIVDDNFLRSLGLSITVGEIVRQLEECKHAEGGLEFIQKVRRAVEPLAVAMNNHPEEYARLTRRFFVEFHRFIAVNEIFSYRIDGGDLHLHLAPSSDIGMSRKIALVRDAFVRLVKIVSSNRSVIEISATSPLVTSNPKLFTGMGFRIQGPISEERQKEDFGVGTPTAFRATMTRQEFIAKYSSQTGFVSLIKSWIAVLRRMF